MNKTKRCCVCKNDLSLNNFNKRTRSSDGLDGICKLCSKNYYSENKEYILARNKIYRDEHKEEKKIVNNAWLENNKKKSRETAKTWKKNNNEKVQAINKRSNKVHYHKYREKCLQLSKDYYSLNKEKISEYKREYEKNKKVNNPLYRLKCRIKCLIGQSFLRNGYTKNLRTLIILGCTFEELKIHLESKFEPWMNWENRGLYNGKLNFGWDIDHIIPLDTATTEEDIIKLNHYTNLQPLCSKINRDIKRNKTE
jgi:hypothetical protein